jgi:hypothetical protein
MSTRDGPGCWSWTRPGREPSSPTSALTDRRQPPTCTIGVQSWISGLGDRLAEVDIGDERAYVLREDLDELASTPPTRAVRLLPGYDQWVLGPGTADPHVVPPARRTMISRQASLVVAGGMLSGTWAMKGDALAIDWFAEAGEPPRAELAKEVARLGAILARELRLTLASK